MLQNRQHTIERLIIMIMLPNFCYLVRTEAVEAGWDIPVDRLRKQGV